MISFDQFLFRDANFNAQKMGKIQTAKREIFKLTCNFKTCQRDEDCPIWMSKWTKMFEKRLILPLQELEGVLEYLIIKTSETVLAGSVRFNRIEQYE